MRYSGFQDLLFGGVVVGSESFTTFDVVVDEFDDGWVDVVEENFLGEGVKIYGVESLAHVRETMTVLEGGWFSLKPLAMVFVML